MIKNSQPELEAFLTRGSAVASPDLIGRLEAIGLAYQMDGELIRLPDSIEILDAEVIVARAQAALGYSAPLQIEIHRQVDSTNEVVMQALDLSEQVSEANAGLAGSAIPVVCLAEMQTAGKGRRGRTWVSPFGRNIYLSVGRGMRGPISRLEGLSLVIGMQVVDAFHELGFLDIGLKWPNDLLLNGGKLGGILIELRPPKDGQIGVVIGVGINLVIDDRSASMIDQPWSDVSDRAAVSRNELAGLLIARLLVSLERFNDAGFEPFAADWGKYNLFADKQVRVIRGHEEFTGVDRGIDKLGNLLLETDRGLETHNSGEVSMRPLPNS